MGCSFAGLVAIIVVGVGAVLNIVSFSLPMWSTSTLQESLGGQSVSADFTAGPWGYCTDFKASNKSSDNEDVVFDHCFLFHTSSKFDKKELKDVDEDLADKLSGKSVCDGYDQANKLGEVGLKAFTASLALVAKIDATAFGNFLSKACSFLGTLEILFGVLACLTGAAAFVLLLLGVTCCRKASSFNGLCKVLVVFTFVLELLTVVLWVVEAHPINKLKGVGFSGSFVIAVISAFLFMISIVLVQRHISMHASN